MKKNPKDMMWGIYIYMTDNIAPRYLEKQEYDEEVWEYFMDEIPKNRLNAVVVSAMDNIVYSSHPEIALKDAWSQERLRNEVERYKKNGISVIPELNFSSYHSYWLKEYRRMTSSKVYYQVVKDLLEEAYELFDHPEYMCITMDEEFYTREEVQPPGRREDMAIVRKSDLLFHDIRYMIDIIKGLGSMPIVAYDCLRMFPEKFKATFSKDDLVLMPWHYLAINPEHFMPDPKNPEKLYERDTPWVQRDLKGLQEVAESDYNLIFLTGRWLEYPNDYSHRDAMEFLLENVSEERIVGFLSTSWALEKKEYLKFHEKDLSQFVDARKKVFGI